MSILKIQEFKNNSDLEIVFNTDTYFSAGKKENCIRLKCSEQTELFEILCKYVRKI